MANRPLYGPQVKYNSSDAQRQNMLAQRLLGKGVDTSPVRGGWGEALARVGTAGLGGYFANQAGETEKQYNADRQALLAKALSGDPNTAAQTLLSDPKTADMGSQLALNNMMFNRERSAKKEDTAEERQYQTGVRKEERGYRLEDLYLTQGFQEKLAKMQMAQQSGLAEEARKHATDLQKMQQDFMSGENTLNREADAEKQKAAALLAKVPQGYQPAPGGGVQPIPGSPQATEAEDLKKSKAEAIVSVDRMIRNIDDLAVHPGLSDTIGFGLGTRYIPGTDAASFDTKLETLKAQGFLPMVAQLKGMGQLSNAEGDKLTSAIGALSPRMSEKEFKASLAEIKTDLQMARKRMGAPDEPTVPQKPRPSGDVPPPPNGFTVLP